MQARQRQRKRWAAQRQALIARAKKPDEQLHQLTVAVGKHAKARCGTGSEQQARPDGHGPLRRRRGQQPGSKGHGRRQQRYAGLPEVHGLHDVPEEDQLCPPCGQRATELPEETSEELDVQPVVRRLIRHRQRYALRCHCPGPFFAGRGCSQAE